MPHRFIVSAGRAGTTFMARAFNDHPDVCCQIESHHLPLLIEAFGDKPASARAMLAVMDQARFTNLDPVINFTLKQLNIDQGDFFQWQQELMRSHSLMTIAEFQGELAGFLLAQTGKSIYVDKTPCYGWRLPQLRAALHDVRVVNMVRDCIPSVKSMALHPGFITKLRLETDNWTEILLHHPYWTIGTQEPVENIEEFEAMAGLWARRTNIVHVHEDQPQVLDFRYEDLLINPFGFLGDLCKALDIPYDMDWAEHVSAQIKPPKSSDEEALSHLNDMPEIAALRRKLGYHT